jgi:hypothetical protein
LISRSSIVHLTVGWLTWVWRQRPRRSGCHIPFPVWDERPTAARFDV